MTGYKTIDLASYSRREHFLYFSSLAYPYAGVTTELDITGFMKEIREKKCPFFLSFLYAVAGAANAVPELRRRIKDGGIVEFNNCPASYTVALPDGTFCYCRVDCDMPFDEFLPYARAAQEQAKLNASVEDGEDALSLLFMSSTPWFSYTSIVQPTPYPADSNPRITWGKYFERNGRTLIPVTVLCHHALVDGIHFARFFDEAAARLGGK